MQLLHTTCKAFYNYCLINTSKSFWGDQYFIGDLPGQSDTGTCHRHSQRKAEAVLVVRTETLILEWNRLTVAPILELQKAHFAKESVIEVPSKKSSFQFTTRNWFSFFPVTLKSSVCPRVNRLSFSFLSLIFGPDFKRTETMLFYVIGFLVTFLYCFKNFLIVLY